MSGFSIIHFAGNADERRIVRSDVDDEPRVHGDAMSANARAGPQYIDAWVTIGKADHFPHVQFHLVSDNGKLVGKGNVHIAVAVFDKLCHFRCSSGRSDTFSAHKATVETQCFASTTREIGRASSREREYV